MNLEYYKTPNGILYNGDCLEIMSNIPSESIDLIFADPPYNVGKDYGETWDDNLPDEVYLQWVDSWIKEGFRLLKDTGSFFLLINTKFGHKIANILDKYGNYRNTIIWMKRCSPIQSNRYLAKNYRFLLFYSKADKYKFYPDIIRVPHRYYPGDIIPGRNPKGRRLDDVWDDISELVGGYCIQSEVIRYSKTQKMVLPPQCPEKVISRTVILTTDINDTVLDPFMGMGTTAAVAEKGDRKWVGIEINPNYCSWVVKRLEPILSQRKLF